FTADPLIAAGNKRVRDLLRIALVHLATVSFDEKRRHGSRTIHSVRRRATNTAQGGVAKRPGKGFAWRCRSISSAVHGFVPRSLNNAIPITPTLRVLWYFSLA